MYANTHIDDGFNLIDHSGLRLNLEIYVHKHTHRRRVQSYRSLWFKAKSRDLCTHTHTHRRRVQSYRSLWFKAESRDLYTHKHTHTHIDGGFNLIDHSGLRLNLEIYVRKHTHRRRVQSYRSLWFKAESRDLCTQTHT